MSEFDWISIITLLGVVQGVFISFILWQSESGIREANRYLSLLICSVSVAISYDVLIYTDLYKALPHLIKTPVPFQFLIGPMLYLYGKEVLFEQTPKREIVYHIIPSVIILCILLPFYFQESRMKIEGVETLLSGQRAAAPTELIVLTAYQVQMWIYFLILFRKVRHQQKRIRNHFSSIREIDLNWLSLLLDLTLVVYVLILIIFILLRLNVLHLEIERMIPLLGSFSIYLIGYRWLIKISKYSGHFRQHIDDSMNELSESGKYRKSPLTRSELIQYKMKLESYLSSEKKYLDPDITLGDIADDLSLSRHILSQVINQAFKMNFFNLINFYRIEEAKKTILKAGKNKTNFLQIAFACGFNSKATFNSAFKKFVKQTPSQFRKQSAF